MKEKFYQNINFKVNDYESTLEIPIQCPNSSNGCKSDNIKKDGHDTSVKFSPQKFTCKDCQVTFYAHTSAFYREIEPAVNELMLHLFEKGKIDSNSIKNILECSDSSVSIILKRVMEAINESITVKMAWETPSSGNVIFVDETWIKIFSKTWYLVVVVSEDRRVLGWKIVEKRTAEVVASLIYESILRLPCPPTIIVTDDFSVYKKVVKQLNYNLIHIRHIHKPPHQHMIIDIIEHKPNKIITTDVATTNDIFCAENTFLTRISTSEENLHEKGKRGRKKGSKNPKKKNINKKNLNTKKKEETWTKKSL